MTENGLNQIEEAGLQPTQQTLWDADPFAGFESNDTRLPYGIPKVLEALNDVDDDGLRDYIRTTLNFEKADRDERIVLFELVVMEEDRVLDRQIIDAGTVMASEMDATSDAYLVDPTFSSAIENVQKEVASVSREIPSSANIRRKGEDLSEQYEGVVGNIERINHLRNEILDINEQPLQQTQKGLGRFIEACESFLHQKERTVNARRQLEKSGEAVSHFDDKFITEVATRIAVWRANQVNDDKGVEFGALVRPFSDEEKRELAEIIERLTTVVPVTIQERLDDLIDRFGGLRYLFSNSLASVLEAVSNAKEQVSSETNEVSINEIGDNLASRAITELRNYDKVLFARRQAGDQFASVIGTLLFDARQIRKIYNGKLKGS